MAVEQLDEEVIFDLARRIDVVQARMDYLDQVCGQDAALRARVEALLQVHEQKPDFLTAPAAVIATSEEPIQERPGTTVGPYKLLEQIGEGGFGLVFMAEQQHPVRRKVAVKVLKPGMDSRQVIARFEAERQALALMDHPNIAKVLEAGETDSGHPFFAMELVRGVPMTDYCDKNNLSTRERLELFLTVCQAVQHAHQKGIIHRDLKPSNIMVTLHDGVPVVKVIDFGIAKALGQQLTSKTLYTGFAQLIGTPLYMSPEQAEMSGLDVDTRSDIYSLGVLLYELLTGTTPFDKERLSRAGYDEMRRIIREEEPLRPSTRISTMGQAATPVSARRQSDPKGLSQLFRGELDWIVMKALEKDRNRRYETANSLAADVQRFLHDEPVLACPPSTPYRLRKLARRHRWALTLTGVVVVALVVLAAGSLVAALFLNQALRESEDNRLRAEGAETTASAAKEAAEERLYSSLLAQARASRLSRRSGQRFKSLEAVKEAAKTARKLNNFAQRRNELRTEVIAALCVADLEMDREVGREVVGAVSFAIDAAFQRYAVANYKDGKVRICRLSDDGELLQLPGGGTVSREEDLEFSPDGRFLHHARRVQKGFRSRMWDLAAPGPKAVLDDEHFQLAFSPDGRQCAACYSRDRTIRTLETASGRELRRFRLDVDLAYPYLHLAWNPRLPQLLIGTGRDLWLLDLNTGQVARVAPGFLDEYDWEQWHPDGRILAVSGSKNDERQIHLWDVAASRPALPALLGHYNGGIQMRFNHAGDRLLSTDWSASGKLWDTRSGQLLLSLPGIGSTPYFSPDDRLVGTGSRGKVQLYRFRRGEELQALVHNSSTGRGFYPQDFFLDPAGRFCACRIHPEGIALMDIARGEEAGQLPLPGIAKLVGFEAAGALWTGGSAGLLRWPGDDPKTGQRCYGPPQRILPHAVDSRHGASADLGVVAIPQLYQGAIVFHRDSKRLVRLGPQEDVRSTAVSPDGCWVATGSHHLHEGAGTRVWDARDGRHVKDLPVGGVCNVWFSPNGKWLLTSGGEPRLWAVGTWEEGPKLGGTRLNSWGAFSCDGKLLALGDEPGIVRLLVTDTGTELVRLTAPDQVRLEPSCFTPDGTKLLATATETGVLYIFDLAAIRTGLAELDLDWDAPPLPAVSKAVPPPLSIHFDMGDMAHWAEADDLVEQAARQVTGNEYASALATLEKAVELAPSYANAHNNLARLLLTGPKELRDPARALAEARKAVELTPEQALYNNALALYHNTLGGALYRAGQWAEAIPVLERNLREQKGQTEAFDLFFLAMCHHRLGEPAKAKECREGAVNWFESHQGQLPASWLTELKEFQAEADKVLAEPPGQPKK
jgi:serine/threonine protein kinase/WD40 repeat protein/Tfp pilus assembly protein PilF